MEAPGRAGHLVVMNEVERRSLARALLLLVVVSGLRWGWHRRPAALPVPEADAAPALLASTGERVAEEARRTRPLGSGERLDPNRAPAEELDRLPGIGPATAAAIVARRDSVGGFRTPGDLKRIPGIGPATVAKLEKHLAFPRPPGPTGRAGSRPAGPPVRVDVNRADEAGLQALPGVGPALAQRIVEARAVRPFRSLEDLLEVKGIGPATLERLRSLAVVGR